MLRNVVRQKAALESAVARLGLLNGAVGTARAAEQPIAAAAAALQHTRQYNPTTGWSHSWQDRNITPPEASKTWKLLHKQGAAV